MILYTLFVTTFAANLVCPFTIYRVFKKMAVSNNNLDLLDELFVLSYDVSNH